MILIFDVLSFRMATQFSQSVSCFLLAFSVFTATYMCVCVYCVPYIQSPFLVYSGWNHPHRAIWCHKEQAVETQSITTTTLQLDLRVPGLNVNKDTNYPDLVFHNFPKYLQANAEAVPKRRPWPLPSKSIPTYHQSWSFRHLSEIGISLLHYLRKHKTCITHNNKSNNFMRRNVWTF